MNPLIRTEPTLAIASVDPESALMGLRLLNSILRVLDAACGGDAAEYCQDGFTLMTALGQADDGNRKIQAVFGDDGEDTVTIKIGPYTGP